MNSPDLKELEKFFKICRRQGVKEITMDAMSVKFGDLPSKQADDSEEIPTEELTPEQLMFYAVGSQP